MKSAVGYGNRRARQAQAPLRLVAPARAGSHHPTRHPRSGAAPVRAPGLRADDDGGDRGRGRRRAQDRLRGLRDQERPAAGALEPPAARRPRRGARGRAAVVPRGDGGAPSRAPSAADRAQLARGQAPHRRRARGDPHGRADRSRHRRALAPHRDRVPRQPAHDRREPRRAAGAGGSTSSVRPTSCGRSTTRACGSCSSSSAAGRRSSTSSGARTPPARSSCSAAARRRSRGSSARRAPWPPTRGGGRRGSRSAHRPGRP